MGEKGKEIIRFLLINEEGTFQMKLLVFGYAIYLDADSITCKYGPCIMPSTYMTTVTKH